MATGLVLNTATGDGEDVLHVKATKDTTMTDVCDVEEGPHLSIVIGVEGWPLIYVEGGDNERLFEWIHTHPALLELVRQAQAIRDRAAGN